MSDPTHTSALDGRATAAHGTLLQASIWTLATLTLVGLVLLISLVLSARYEREAGRMMVESQKGAGYVSMVTTAFAARHGQPRGF